MLDSDSGFLKNATFGTAGCYAGPNPILFFDEGIERVAGAVVSCVPWIRADADPLDPHASRIEYTTDVGRRCAYANMLTNHLISDTSAVAFLDITDWAVWPSSQNMDLYYAYRRCLGEARLLIDAHFHVFTASEAKELRNILHLGLISLFDVAGASTTTDFRFYASHDEYIQVRWYEGAEWLPTAESFFAP